LTPRTRADSKRSRWSALALLAVNGALLIRAQRLGRQSFRYGILLELATVKP
jgi:hypothetical protein